jgi:hypothetical protein
MISEARQTEQVDNALQSNLTIIPTTTPHNQVDNAMGWL